MFVGNIKKENLESLLKEYEILKDLCIDYLSHYKCPKMTIDMLKTSIDSYTILDQEYRNLVYYLYDDIVKNLQISYPIEICYNFFILWPDDGASNRAYLILKEIGEYKDMRKHINNINNLKDLTNVKYFNQETSCEMLQKIENQLYKLSNILQNFLKSFETS